jgi:hypothetical protein
MATFLELRKKSTCICQKKHLGKSSDMASQFWTCFYYILVYKYDIYSVMFIVVDSTLLSFGVFLKLKLCFTLQKCGCAVRCTSCALVSCTTWMQQVGTRQKRPQDWKKWAVVNHLVVDDWEGAHYTVGRRKADFSWVHDVLSLMISSGIIPKSTQYIGDDHNPIVESRS